MRKALLGMAVAACVLGASACGGSSSSGGGGGGGGVFRVGTTTGIDSMNPFVGNYPDANTVYGAVYSYLVHYDQDMNYQGDLATAWKAEDGGKRWVFTLRPGVKWSDGQALDASDVADFVNWANKQTGLGRVEEAFGKDFIKATAPSPTELVFSYRRPAGVVLSKMARWPILPPQVWTKMSGKQASEYENTSPVGSGPFTVQKYAKNQTLLAKANPGYYGAKPKIDGFGLQQYDNTDAMIQALKSGQLDGIETIPGNAYQKLKQDPSLNVTSTPSSFEAHFMFNSNPNKKEHKELLDPRVRQAFADAIDKKALLRLIWDGQGSLSNNFYPSAYGDAPGTGKPWASPNIKDDPFDPAEANRILDDLGYKRGANGIRVADGHPMDYDLILPTDGYAGITRVADLIQGWLKNIGVKVNLRPMDGTQANNTIIGSTAAVKTPKNSYLDWDIGVWNWTAQPDPDALLVTTTTGQFGILSDSGYTNPTYDRLYEKQLHTVGEDKRLPILWKMQEMLAKDHAYITLVHANLLQAVNKDWQGLVQTPRGFFNELSPYNLLHVHKA